MLDSILTLDIVKVTFCAGALEAKTKISMIKEISFFI
jgi:hypothetical protein